jgi:hypothetical protein
MNKIDVLYITEITTLITMDKEISLECLAKRLPEDITRHIYEEYMHPKHKYNKMIRLLKSEKCKKLVGYKELSLHLEDMFETQDMEFLLYTLKHGKEHKFNFIYNKTIVYKHRYFLRINNKYEAMALAWLFILYH